MEKIFPFLFLPLLLLLDHSSAQMPGFISINCGGKENFTDEHGLNWISDEFLTSGESAIISVTNQTRKTYTSVRHFPADSRKYCYNLNVVSRTRYLVRATFLYGNFDNNNVYPQFDISLGPTHWSTIVISGANTVESKEVIFLATSDSISVCLSNGTTGKPFISTLELRQFNGSVYYTPFEERFYLSVAARINFGADTRDPIRYPDDPFDRIWESDSVKRANYLVDVAVGTQKVSTTKHIDVRSSELPPEKVMRTAVVGTKGMLTYRVNLKGFPGFGWGVIYFSEIEDLGSNESRKFRLAVPEKQDLSNAVVNILENARGKYRVYEPGYPNISFPFVFSFRFEKTNDSTRGPLLNAIEISKYVEKKIGSIDGTVIGNVASSLYPYADWAREDGDPCLPVPWSWVKCNSENQPRIVSIFLSRKNLTGNIPTALTKLRGLVELWLDGNLLTGSIPDFSKCVNLKIIHLENNKLTGELPSFLRKLPNLKELYVQNNMLSGKVPSGLFRNYMVSDYSGNVSLREDRGNEKEIRIIIGSILGAAFLFIASIVCFTLLCKKKNREKEKFQHPLPTHQPISSSTDLPPTDAAQCFALSDIKNATNSFEKKIGSGGFGVVYYGKLKDGKEIAVKVLTSNSLQGKREFANEVTLLSRMHHRNLVQFYGFCQGEGKGMLVYEFMHNGTLKENLYGPVTREKTLDWIKRLEIAEDAAKGIEYLHTGCVPAIIHRDLKSSNILLDKHMRAKVSDFGLSKLAVDGETVSSVVRGTVGYLDPEYYISQQLTDKSDVYSFGVILLELMSGREAISDEKFGVNCRNIVLWAKMHIESGDIQGIIDPSLQNEYDIQSMWKIAEKALMCVQPHGHMRPSISEVVKEIQDAIFIEKEALAMRNNGVSVSDDIMSRHSVNSSFNMSTSDFVGTDNYLLSDESIAGPAAR